jgi:hypothetical protein
MRFAGFLAAIFALASAGAGASDSDAVLTATTAKSLDFFGQCFVQTQQRAARPWWFVPKANGGIFSNLGAKNAEGIYFLDVEELASTGRMKLKLQTTTPSTAQAIRVAIGQCV